ncbi:uncharacterized protein PRCAT00001031001 [Priceomyces carsonii]|uniref:uncharacterized protein n=1 Tax=Priceomyces carsonii TaxID=28549 RepID=UPI002ED7CE75|nr:unnamed protein product [Priceomyces carsonii]
MFNKFKLRKAPLSLSSVSNAFKTSGIQGLTPDDISPKHLGIVMTAQLGLPNNSIVAIAYDPVQSLLAVSTLLNDVRVYGQDRVEVVFEFRSTNPMTLLKFVKGVYLVAASPSSGLTVLSLHSKKILGTYLPSGSISTMESDPSLDWLMLGLSNGSIIFYDVDRLSTTPLRIDNLQKKIMPKQKLSAVLSIEWHPRDIGTILVTYSHSAILYSIADGDIVNSFVYKICRGARGFDYSYSITNNGKKKIFGSAKETVPSVIESHFHPNGLHVVTVHGDNTLAFWDAQSGTLLEARTLDYINMQKEGEPIAPPNSFSPILNVRWICGEDPELTQLAVSGGNSDQNVITIIDFGITLKYSLASYEKQSDFYARPQMGQRKIEIAFNLKSDSSESEYITHILPLTTNCLPYFNGNHNPQYLMFLSNLGSLYMKKFNMYAEDGFSSDLEDLVLPPSVAMILPPVTKMYVVTVPRIQWFGVLSNRVSTNAGATKVLLKGGAPVSSSHLPKAMGYDEGFRNILVSGHNDGVVRLVDVSRSDHQDPCNTVQISLKDCLYEESPQSISVVDVSCSLESAELIVGLANGSVAICKYGRSPTSSKQGSFKDIDYRSCLVEHKNGDFSILSLKGRVKGSLTSASSFVPVSILNPSAFESISCLKMSNVGFAAVGYSSGRIIVCDVSRGPAIIMNASLREFAPSVDANCYVTSMEFAIMEYGQDGFSSILLLVGTNCGGNLLIFRIVPKGNGAFEVVFADKTLGLNYKSRVSGQDDESEIRQLVPINSKNGESAVASLDMFHKLSQGVLIPGFVVVASDKDVRIIKIPKMKLSHKVIEDTCLSCGIFRLHGKGIVLATLVKSGFVKLSSIPGLHDVADVKMPLSVYDKCKNRLDAESAFSSSVQSTGDAFIATSETELINISVCVKSGKINDDLPTDLLFNENAIIPARPAASALLWAKGQTKYISSQDLAQLIAGPNRRTSKNVESQLAHNISPEANPSLGYGGYAPASEENDRGYKPPVRKAGKGGRVFGSSGFMKGLQDGIDSVEESFNGYAGNVSESVSNTMESHKKQFYNEALKSKFGL